ncbi:MAG TPA: SHOCT domain-containing protein [Acidimicrobiales bacterium]|nr:SHOCT domain-containing protein [Acidimicrobiales bacterium]
MPGLIGGIARTAVIAGTATAVSNRVSRRQADRWARQDQSDYAQPQYAQPQYAQPAPAPAVASSGTDEMLEQLRELGQLKDQGVLTEEEFAAQKARILGT